MIRFLFVVMFVFILIMPAAWGSMTTYPDPNRQTMWNDLTDGMHTLGKSPQQARLTKMKLHHTRTLARLRSINQARQQRPTQNN